MLKFLSRLWRHVYSGPMRARKVFSAATLQNLHTIITEGEAEHRAEVRLIIEAAMPLRKVWRGMPSRQRAIDLFGTYRVWDSEENNGVLLYVNLADRTLELVCDRAAARAITADEWQRICADMLAAYRAGQFEQGTAEGLRAIHRELREFFPAHADAPRSEDAGQPDAPIML